MKCMNMYWRKRRKILLMTQVFNFNHSDFRLFAQMRNAQKVLNSKFFSRKWNHWYLVLLWQMWGSFWHSEGFLQWIMTLLQVSKAQKSGFAQPTITYVLNFGVWNRKQNWNFKWNACICIEGKEEKLPRNYVDVIKNDSCNAVDVDFI